MEFAHRVRLARRHAGYSQAELAKRVGVRRSAVSHWEAAASGTSPSPTRLQTLALVTGVSFEWLATGRGSMLPDRAMLLDSVAATTGILVEDALELRLVEAFRRAPVRARMALVEVVEALAKLRGRA